MAPEVDYSGELKAIDVTIANGTSLSGAVPLGGRQIVGISMPAAWTAAGITLQGSADGGATYQDVYDAAGTEYAITAAAARHIVLDPNELRGLTHVKVRSGTSAAPVNQLAERTVRLLFYGED